MEKEIMTKQNFCDICGKKSSGYEKCFICGKEFCYDCKKIKAVEYQYGVHFSGSIDGLYCSECDNKAFETADKLHAAYLKIKMLRNEEANWYASFKKQTDEAEKTVESLYRNRKR